MSGNRLEACLHLINQCANERATNKKIERPRGMGLLPGFRKMRAKDLIVSGRVY